MKSLIIFVILSTFAVGQGQIEMPLETEPPTTTRASTGSAKLVTNVKLFAKIVNLLKNRIQLLTEDGVVVGPMA
jgi:hypothetical protein